jgi:phosphoglycolate phosphatase
VGAVDCLLFDLDGTLVDSRADIAGAVNHTLRTLGRPTLSLEVVTQYVGDGVRQLLTRAAGPMSDEEMARGLSIFLPYYLDHCAETTTLYPGVRETLARCEGRAMALVTNKPAAHTAKTLAALELEKAFGVVLGGDSLPTRKPAPEPLWEALRLLGAAPERALMVGDSLADIHAARAAGVRVAAVTYGFRPADELRAASPDFVFNTITDLWEVLR